MSVPSKKITVDISIDAHKYVAEIVKRTGETKVKLFERIIQSEYKRIMNNESVPDAVNKQLESVSSKLDEAIESSKKGAENSAAIRDGSNKIYCSVLLSIKELFRTMHFLSGCFSNISLLPKEQLSIISSKADQDASESFAAIYKMLNELQPKAIVDTLRKKQ